MITDKQALRKLREGVTSATGADRELDALFVCALCPEAQVAIYIVGDDEPSVFHAERLGIANKSDVPAYSASVDAALSLIERVLKDPHHTLSGPAKYLNIPTPIPNYWWAEIVHDFPGKTGRRGWGAAPALALLAALLEAKIMEAENDA